MNYNAIQDNWAVNPNHAPYWQKARLTHRLAPLLVWLPDEEDPMQKVLKPTDYIKVLPGATVEVHFTVHLHAWGTKGFFVNKIVQIIVWEKGKSAPPPPSIYDTLSIDDGPYRKKRTLNAVSSVSALRDDLSNPDSVLGSAHQQCPSSGSAINDGPIHYLKCDGKQLQPCSPLWL